MCYEVNDENKYTNIINKSIGEGPCSLYFWRASVGIQSFLIDFVEDRIDAVRMVP